MSYVEEHWRPSSYQSSNNNATRFRAHTFRPGRSATGAGERTFVLDPPPRPSSPPETYPPAGYGRPRRISDPYHYHRAEEVDGRGAGYAGASADELGRKPSNQRDRSVRFQSGPPPFPLPSDYPTGDYQHPPSRRDSSKHRTSAPSRMAADAAYDEKVGFDDAAGAYTSRPHHNHILHHHHAEPQEHGRQVHIEDPNDPRHELTAEDFTSPGPSRSSSFPDPNAPRHLKEAHDVERDGRTRTDDEDGLHFDHFADAHGTAEKAAGNHVAHVHHPLSWRHLFKRPVIRQWLRGSKLYRGIDRDTTYVELFFDLMFVGIIHQLAEGAVQPVSRESVAKFILAFYPSWSVWSDVRNFVNHSGVDDFPQRIYILATMLLLLGYSAMVSSIELEPVGSDAEPIPPPESSPAGEGEAFPLDSFAVRYHMVDYHDALQAATAFFLVAKLLRLSLYLIYAFKLPRFRKSLLLSALQFLLPCALWFPLLWVTSQATVVDLAAAAIGVELGMRYVVGIVAKLDRKRAFFGGSDWFVPALSIEHMIDRISAFITVVLGESIINSTYAVTTQSGQVGIHAEYGRAAFALCIAFVLMLLYFDCDASRTYIHSLRRHWITSIANIQLHWPLSAGLILMSAALPRMVRERSTEIGLRWYFAGGTAVAVFCTALIGWMHLSLDAPHTCLLPRRLRLLLRVMVAVFIACMPLFMPDGNLAMLGVVAAVLGALLIVETFGKIGAESIETVDILNPPPGKGRSRWGSRWGHGIRKDDLTDAERGEEDVGVEEGLSQVQIKIRTVQPHQRLAYTW